MLLNWYMSFYRKFTNVTGGRDQFNGTGRHPKRYDMEFNITCRFKIEVPRVFRCNFRLSMKEGRFNSDRLKTTINPNL